MEKKQLTLDDIRQAIAESNAYEITADVKSMTDEAFSQCYFEDDLGMDSLDMLEITFILERTHGLSIPDDATERALKQGTVAALLEEYNKHVC